MHILIIPGSLRTQSFNKALARAMVPLMPDGVTAEVLELNGLPLMNEDLETPLPPQEIQDFRATVRKANALILLTPEYNHFFTAAMKNAIEWMTREYGDDDGSVIAHKPVAIGGVTPGGVGTARASVALRSLLAEINASIFPVHYSKELLVSKAHTLVNDAGDMTDQATLEKAQSFVEDFVVFVGE